MNKKIFAAMMIIFVIAVFIPWIWLIQTFGMENIPHYDLTMWIFIMLYGLIATLIFLGIVVIGFSLKEEEPKPKRKRKTVKQKPKPKPKTKASKKNDIPKEKQVIEEEAPAELQENGTEQLEQIEKETVEYPAEWETEKFE